MENQQPYTPPFRGAIFDMDGTLVDNSPVHVRAFEIFCNRYHVEGWREKFTTAFGRGNDEIMPMLLPEEIIREKGIPALAEEKEAIYREIYAPEIEPVKGLVELLQLLRKAGIRCAVGSSGCRANVDFVLEKCGIADYFEVVISGDMVSRCKPEPEIYLTAAQALGLDPKECIIFEDARAGFESARRAGAGRLVAIATTLQQEVLVSERLADLVVGDFSEIRNVEQLR
ncbi:MAG: HAD family phosphatase [Alistipes sp.]|nr:HAD family phosphatase [Alistipes sp.]